MGLPGLLRQQGLGICVVGIVGVVGLFFSIGLLGLLGRLGFKDLNVLTSFLPLLTVDLTSAYREGNFVQNEKAGPQFAWCK